MVDGPNGWAVRITDGGAGLVDPEADPALPSGVSHLLVADDVLIPGRWGSHITLCGQEVRRPNVEHDDPLDWPCCRYCPECVREASRWSAESVEQAARAADVR